VEYPQKCPWALKSSIEERYHDAEWGVPLRDDQRLFELLVLEGLQAGLSWRTVLQKRAAYRQAFAGFDAEKIATYDERTLEQCLQNPALIRNRLKMQAIVSNARAYLHLKETQLAFSDFIWQFTEGKVIQNHWQKPQQVPAETALSHQLSQALKQQGFKFVGPVICYAFMQAAGLVNDHLTDCFRYRQLQ
jgi:DNA-3-methyladenine glycosylase I